MGSVRADQLDRSSADLAEVVANPLAWPRIMERIAHGAGASGAALLQSDVRTPDVPRTASVDEMFTNYFENGWHARDIRAARGAPLILGGAPVIIDYDVVTRDEIERGTFYAETLQPYGYRWFAGVGFRAGEASWVLSIQRTVREGPFLPRDKPVLARLSRRLSEVACLSTAVGRIALSSAINALSAVRQPAIAVDRAGRVLEFNEAAASILDHDTSIRHDRFSCTDRRAQNALQNVLKCLDRTPDTVPLQFEPIVCRREGRRPVVVRVLAVPGMVRQTFGGARAFLLLVDLEGKPVPVAQHLGILFGLSPAEARLAGAIAAGRALDEIARELGIGYETARWTLKNVLRKTDTHRQSELVHLLSRLTAIADKTAKPTSS